MSARGTGGGVAGEVGNVATAFVRRLAFLTQPVGGITGALLPTQPVVQVLNDAGNLDVNYNGSVSISLSGIGVLNGTLSVNAVNGIAIWTNLAIVGVGASTLTATAPGLAPIVSNTINTLSLL